MSLRPIGGIFWRPDASGNLTAYDTSGNVLGKFIGGVFQSKVGSANYSVASPTGTTSATFVSTGVGIGYTPQVSTHVLIMQISQANSSVAGDVGVVAIYKNLTGIPANGTGVGSDTALHNSMSFDCVVTTALYNTSSAKVDLSAVVGTQAFYYIAQERASGTGTITVGPNPVIIAIEVN